MSTAEIFLVIRMVLSIVGLIAAGLTLWATTKYYIDLRSLKLSKEEMDGLHLTLNGSKQIMAASRVVAMSLLFIIHCAFIYINVFVWTTGVTAPRTPLSFAWVIAQISAALMSFNNWWTMRVIVGRVH